MTLLRLLALLLLGLMIRRFFLSLRRSPAGPRADRAAPGTPKQGPERRYDGLTDQGIDDADFEEIP